MEKMRIILPNKIEKELYSAVRDAKNNEIGGILMGEYIAGGDYRIIDFTIQASKGTVAAFIRLVAEMINPLRNFFIKTNFNYKKYNYLGEWHSHPNFSLQPSNTDMESMWEIVEDSSTNATFAVLLILRANPNNDQLDGCATIFLPEHNKIQVELIRE